jgi:hypothetical protein
MPGESPGSPLTVFSLIPSTPSGPIISFTGSFQVSRS